MSLSSNISVLSGITGVTPIGGAAKTYVNDGQGSGSRKVLVDASNGDINTRNKILTGVTIGSVPAKGTAKLHRGDVTIQTPYVDSKGVKYNLPSNHQFTYHPEQTLAQRQAMFWERIAIIIDAELSGPLTNMVND